MLKKRLAESDVKLIKRQWQRIQHSQKIKMVQNVFFHHLVLFMVVKFRKDSHYMLTLYRKCFTFFLQGALEDKSGAIHNLQWKKIAIEFLIHASVGVRHVMQPTYEWFGNTGLFSHVSMLCEGTPYVYIENNWNDLSPSLSL